jgi:hypothetical protein
MPPPLQKVGTSPERPYIHKASGENKAHFFQFPLQKNFKFAGA